MHKFPLMVNCPLVNPDNANEPEGALGANYLHGVVYDDGFGNENIAKFASQRDADDFARGCGGHRFSLLDGDRQGQSGVRCGAWLRPSDYFAQGKVMEGLHSLVYVLMVLTQCGRMTAMQAFGDTGVLHALTHMAVGKDFGVNPDKLWADLVALENMMEW